MKLTEQQQDFIKNNYNDESDKNKKKEYKNV